MNEVVTRENYSLDHLNRDRLDRVAISSNAGGVQVTSMLEIIEVGKAMALSEQAVPKHLRKNVGMCLAVTFQAVEWRMSPFQVANKSYVVNDRIAYESQLLHAVVEARAPLRERLDCKYEGEGPERVCTVTGHFIGDSQPRSYSTPKFKDINPKNSPLWKSDPDQQQFYYATRSWARRWAPDVLLGIYTREELSTNPGLGREDEPDAIEAQHGLKARLAASSRAEGHQDGHATTELDRVAGGAVIDHEEPEPPSDQKPKKGGAKAKGKAAEKASAEAKTEASAKPEPAAKITPPQSAAEYEAYAERWIDAENEPDNAEARWEGEREQREALGVPVKVRGALRNRIDDRFAGEA